MADVRHSISLRGIELIDFVGSQDSLLRRMEDAFSGRLVIRGDELVLEGSSAEVERMGLRRAPVCTFAATGPACAAYRNLWAEIGGLLEGEKRKQRGKGRRRDRKREKRRRRDEGRRR